mmetsp:Transcript_13659/g.38924  ORF Transcript_13659/g.38924 Transcript_13659/m.38924 type:complete len:244 (-) Transcript_13659:1410-2141(-)
MRTAASITASASPPSCRASRLRRPQKRLAAARRRQRRTWRRGPGRRRPRPPRASSPGPRPSSGLEAPRRRGPGRRRRPRRRRLPGQRRSHRPRWPRWPPGRAAGASARRRAPPSSALPCPWMPPSTPLPLPAGRFGRRRPQPWLRRRPHPWSRSEGLPQWWGSHPPFPRPPTSPPPWLHPWLPPLPALLVHLPLPSPSPLRRRKERLGTAAPPMAAKHASPWRSAAAAATHLQHAQVPPAAWR